MIATKSRVLAALAAAALWLGCGGDDGASTPGADSTDAAADDGDAATHDSGGDAHTDSGTGDRSPADGGATTAGDSDSGAAGNSDGGGPGVSAATCPATEPARASDCTAEDVGYCYYARRICNCNADASGYYWACGDTPDACPGAVPQVGDDCSQPGQRCVYDFRECAQSNPSTFVCTDGEWTFQARPCS